MKLLTTSRFLPLFITQFLGAFNDNLYKNALVILITYVLAAKSGLNAQLWVTAAGGIFILPFFLFSATAGQLADKYEKSFLIRRIKLAEVALMILACLGFYLQDAGALMAVLFLLGTQASFFGPLKYSILPDHLKEEELVEGNALIEAGTFLAILTGTILGGVLILQEQGLMVVCALLLVMSLMGWLISWKIPVAPAASPQLRMRWNILAESTEIICHSRSNREVFAAILGISWFWFLGAVFLSQFPNLAKNTLHTDETAVTLFLAVFSLGIGAGSLLCNTLLKGTLSTRYVAMAALGMAGFTFALYGCLVQYQKILPDGMIGLAEFLTFSTFSGLILFCLLGIAICGGIYIVPLYTLMQAKSDRTECSRHVAANNILNALFMVGSALLTLALFSLGWEVADVLLLTGIINLPAAWYLHKLHRTAAL